MEQQNREIVNENNYLAIEQESANNYYLNSGLKLLQQLKSNSNENTQAQSSTIPTTDKAPEIQFATDVNDESLPFKDIAGKITKDVAKGVLEIPRASINALSQATSEALDLGYQSIKGLNENLAETIDIPANLSTKIATGEDVQASNLKGWVEKNFPKEIPTIKLLDDPQSNTGKLLQTTLTFLAGFAGAGKITKGVKASKFTKDMLNGAISDMAVFDGQEERLSNLIQSFPQLDNTITNFLQAKETDNEMEGKVKNAFEGAGLGFIAGAVIKGIKAVAKSKAVKGLISKLTKDKNIVKAQTEPISAKTAEEMQKDFSALGDVNKKVFVSSNQTKNIKPNDLLGQTINKKDDLFINFARIETQDDVKKVMQEMANLNKKSINKARRGKQTFQEIELNADKENAWDIMLSRRQGEPLNAEQSVALRRLWSLTSEKLADIADMASKNPSPENLLMFRKMVAIQNMVQKEVISARTETARALSSWRIPTGGAIEINNQITQAITESGGVEKLTEFAKSISKMAKDGDYNAIVKMVDDSSKPNFIDMLLEYRTSALLTSLKTHIVNVVGNTLTLAGDISSRFVAEQFGRLNSWLGFESGTITGESMAELRGMIGAIGDAFTLVKKNWQTGLSEYTGTKAEIEGKQLGAIRSGASLFGYEIKADTLFGKAIDFIGNVTRLPYRALGASDEFFKTVAYRGEVRAQAYRQVMKELEAGTLKKEGLEVRFNELLDNPPENIRIEAQGKAQYLTFTNTPNRLAQNIQKITTEYPVLKLVVPFVRTPANIFDMAMTHTPLAPLYKSFRADVMAGGARQEMALARMATGTCLLLFTGDLAMKGTITGGGPRNPAHRKALLATGWQPYSVKIGDKYYSYERLDPISTVLGLAADFVELSTNTYNDEDTDNEGIASLGMGIVFSLANNLLSKNYIVGISDFVSTISQQEGKSVAKYFNNMTASLVPNIFRDIRNIKDKYQRELFGIIDTMKNRTIGLSETLPVKRDIFGREMSAVSGVGPAYDFLVPVRVNNREAEPIDYEIVKQEVWVQMPRKKLSFGNDLSIDLKDRLDIYSRYVELAGNELKLNGKGCKDFLNEFITTDSYQRLTDGADGSKNTTIRKTINQYRNSAKYQLLKEYPQLQDELDEQKELLRNSR